MIRWSQLVSRKPGTGSPVDQAARQRTNHRRSPAATPRCSTCCRAWPRATAECREAAAQEFFGGGQPVVGFEVREVALHDVHQEAALRLPVVKPDKGAGSGQDLHARPRNTQPALRCDAWDGRTGVELMPGLEHWGRYGLGEDGIESMVLPADQLEEVVLRLTEVKRECSRIRTSFWQA